VSNTFRVRPGELGISFYIAHRCSEEEVVALSPTPGAGLAAVVAAEVESCFEIFSCPGSEGSEELRAAHVELRPKGTLAGDPNVFWKRKGRLLATHATVLVHPDAA